MTLTLWLSLLTASVVISLTPGAGAINTMSNSLSQGWRRSIWGILGQQAALVIHVAIVAAGVGLLVQGSPVLFEIVRYAGVAYLAYLGIRMFLAKPAAAGDADVAFEPERRWSMFRRGLWVNLLNPKAIVFYLAFVPSFIRPDEPQLPQYLVVMATTVIVDLVVMWFFFAAVARPFRKWSATPQGAVMLNRIFGALFLVVAALLVFAPHSSAQVLLT